MGSLADFFMRWMLSDVHAVILSFAYPLPGKAWSDLAVADPAPGLWNAAGGFCISASNTVSP